MRISRSHAAVRTVALGVLALIAMTPASPVRAQSLNEAIVSALDGNCAGLKGATPGAYDSSLAGICIGIPVGASGQSGGAGLATVTTQQITSEERRVKERLREARLALATGETRAAGADSFQLGRLGLFASGEYERFDQDATRFTTGHQSDTKGITFGADYAFTKSVIAGVALTAARTTGSFDENGGSFSTDTWGGMLYASLVPMPNLFVDLTAGYNHKEFDQKRRTLYSFTRGGVPFIVDGFATSETAGEEFRTSAAAGYDFVFGKLTTGPRAGITYKTIAVNGFNEHGWMSDPQMDTGLELNFDRQHEDSLTTTLGLFASMAFSVPFGVIVPQVNAEYVHEFMRDQHAVYFHFHEDFTKTRLRFETEPPDRDYGNVGAGLSLIFPGGLSGFVNYRALVGYSNQASHTVTAGLRFAFQ
jgi:outer membrane autotransporter protein